MSAARPLAGRSVLLAALLSAKVEDPEAELARWAARIASAGGWVVAQVLQRRGISRARSPGGANRMNAPLRAATWFGKGKVQEIGALRAATNAELLVVATARLSPTQRERLARAVGCPVLDASVLE